MRIIGVIDLADGRAVHASGGRRDAYQPVRPTARPPMEPGDAPSLARIYRDTFGIGDLYVADLDAIMGRPPQDTLIRRLVDETRMSLWLDCAVSSIERAREATALGVARVIVGLETLLSYRTLNEICEGIDGQRVAFSLDLRNGEPIARPGVVDPGQSVPDLARRAADAGVGAVIVLDLARVGTGAGLDTPLIARVRKRVPDVMLVAGGGVRGPQDLTMLAACGCDAALVATALHEGLI